MASQLDIALATAPDPRTAANADIGRPLYDSSEE